MQNYMANLAILDHNKSGNGVLEYSIHKKSVYTVSRLSTVKINLFMAKWHTGVRVLI